MGRAESEAPQSLVGMASINVKSLSALVVCFLSGSTLAQRPRREATLPRGTPAVTIWVSPIALPPPGAGTHGNGAAASPLPMGLWDAAHPMSKASGTGRAAAAGWRIGLKPASRNLESIAHAKGAQARPVARRRLEAARRCSHRIIGCTPCGQASGPLSPEQGSDMIDALDRVTSRRPAARCGSGLREPQRLPRAMETARLRFSFDRRLDLVADCSHRRVWPPLPLRLRTSMAARARLSRRRLPVQRPPPPTRSPMGDLRGVPSEF